MDGARAIGRMVATRRFDHAALAVPIVRARPIGKRVVGTVLRAPLWRDVEIPVDAQELFAAPAISGIGMEDLSGCIFVKDAIAREILHRGGPLGRGSKIVKCLTCRDRLA